jgi:AcrR family transcriptional regulator
LAKVALSAELILTTALRLVDDEGLDALTMRHLAEEIGVATMSLYSHVTTKDELLQGVLNLVTTEIPLPAPGTPPWEALRMINRGYRRTATRHPNLVPLTMQQPPTGPENLQLLDAALDALYRAGVDPARTAQAYRLMASFVIGFVSLECGGYFRPVELAAPIDLTSVPRVAEAGPYLAAWDADAEFEIGMDILIGVLSGWTSEVVEGDGGRGGDVEGVDTGPHGDAGPAVDDGQRPGGEPGALGTDE